MHPPYNTAKIAKLAIAGSYTYIASTIIFDLSGLWENSQYQTLLSGDLGYEEANRLADHVDFVVGAAGIATIVVTIITMVINAIWIYRASKNAAFIDPHPNRIRPGWSVGWYFIPIANLWKPFTAMQEIWNSSYSPTKNPEAPAPTLLTLWWTCWILNNIIATGLSRVQFRTEDIDTYMTINKAMLFSTVLSTLSAYFLIQIIKSVSERQMAWTSNDE